CVDCNDFTVKLFANVVMDDKKSITGHSGYRTVTVDVPLILKVGINTSTNHVIPLAGGTRKSFTDLGNASDNWWHVVVRCLDYVVDLDEEGVSKNSSVVVLCLDCHIVPCAGLPVRCGVPRQCTAVEGEHAVVVVRDAVRPTSVVYVDYV